MDRIAGVLARIGIASLASLTGVSAHGGLKASKGEITPFSYEMTVTHFSGGVSTRTENVLRAVRRDGSYAQLTRMHGLNGDVYHRHEIMDLKAQRRSISYSGVDVVTTVPVRQKTSQEMRADKRSRCGLGRQARASRIHGIDVIRSGIDTTRDLGDEGIQVETWIAPSLGCEALQTTWRKRGQVVLTREINRIEIGDPSDALFENSPALTETTPGNAARRLAEGGLEGGSGISPGPIGQRIDEEYFRGRSAAGWD